MSYLPKKLGNPRAWIGVPASYYRSPHVPLEFRMPEAGPKIFQRPVPRETFTQVIRKPKPKPAKLFRPKPTYCPPPPGTVRMIPYDPALGQWGTVATVATQAIPFFKGIFGGDGKKRRAGKIAAAHAGGQQILGSITNLPILIDKIEKYLNGHTHFFECPLGARSTTGRGCFVAACQAAKKLGWDNPRYGDCNPYMKAPLDFGEVDGMLKTFFARRLPELKAEFERRQAPPPAPPFAPPFAPVRQVKQVLAPSMIPFQQPLIPTYLPRPIGPLQPQYPQIISLPTPTPTFYEEPLPPVQAAIDPQFIMWGGLGLLALMMMR